MRCRFIFGGFCKYSRKASDKNSEGKESGASRENGDKFVACLCHRGNVRDKLKFEGNGEKWK